MPSRIRRRFIMALSLVMGVPVVTVSPAATTPVAVVEAATGAATTAPVRGLVLRPQNVPQPVRIRIQGVHHNYRRTVTLSARKHVRGLRAGLYRLRGLPTADGSVRVFPRRAQISARRGAAVKVRWRARAASAGEQQAAPPAADAGRTPRTEQPLPAAERGREWYRANTGVPNGVTLQTTGPLTITRDGSVIDGKRVQGGITINARDVTIRNSLVLGPITNVLPGDRYNNGVPDQRILIEHVEVDLSGLPIGTAQARAINSGWGTTVRFTKVHGTSQGINVAGDMTITDSYFYNIRSQGAHSEAILGNGNPMDRARAIRIERNWLDASDDNARSGSGSTYVSGALCLYGDFGQIRDVTIADNYLEGAGYLLYAGAVPGKPFPVPSNVEVRGNVFDPDGWGPVYPAALDTTSRSLWRDNVLSSGRSLAPPA